MSCATRDNVLWCGKDGQCNRSEKSVKSSSDQKKIAKCPPYYRDLGFKKYQQVWPAPSQYRRACQRIQSTKKQCCLGQTISPYCPNGYCPGNAACVSYLQKECDANKLKYDKGCRQWCLDNPGKCDYEVSKYCKTPAGKADPFCGCVNSELEVNAACFDINCVNVEGAYRTKNQEQGSQKCPAYMDCRQFINLSPDAQNNVLNNVTLKQQCYQQGNGNGNETTVTPAIPLVPPKASTDIIGQFQALSTEEQYSIIAVFILFVAIVLYLILTAASTKQGGSSRSAGPIN